MRTIFAFLLGILGLNLQVQAQPLPATTRVQILNATCVPIIALKINDRVAYDAFPQGRKTADGPVPLLEAIYEAEDKQRGAQAKSEKIAYEPNSYQSLVILGDFSTDSPPGEIKQPGQALRAEEKQYSPNVLFQVFSHAATKPPVRLRVINGMPGKSLIFGSGTNEITVKPSECAVLESQPATIQYMAEVDGESVPVLMRQEGLIRNAIVVFFLKSGKPAFMRAFENNAESDSMRVQLEKTGE